MRIPLTTHRGWTCRQEDAHTQTPMHTHSDTHTYTHKHNELSVFPLGHKRDAVCHVSSNPSVGSRTNRGLSQTQGPGRQRALCGSGPHRAAKHWLEGWLHKSQRLRPAFDHGWPRRKRTGLPWCQLPSAVSTMLSLLLCALTTRATQHFVDDPLHLCVTQLNYKSSNLNCGEPAGGLCVCVCSI